MDVNPEPESRQTRLRILIVEDDEAQSAPLATLLKGCGHDAVVAPNGLVALELATATAPDVVLLDICLPGLDGHEVAHRIRALHLPRRPVIIAVTGHPDEFARLQPCEDGMDICLRKPTDLAFVKNLLDRLALQLRR